MRITHNKTVIADSVVVCHRFFEQVRGLILRKKTNLLFVFSSPRRVHLHMVGVLYPIDVVLLDSLKRVVQIQRLYPFQFFTSTVDALYVLEIARGSVKGLSKGDRVNFLK